MLVVAIALAQAASLQSPPPGQPQRHSAHLAITARVVRPLKVVATETVEEGASIRIRNFKSVRLAVEGGALARTRGDEAVIVPDGSGKVTVTLIY